MAVGKTEKRSREEEEEEEKDKEMRKMRRETKRGRDEGGRERKVQEKCKGRGCKIKPKAPKVEMQMNKISLVREYY